MVTTALFTRRPLAALIHAALAAVTLAHPKPALTQQDTTRQRAVVLDPIVVTAERRDTRVSESAAISRVIEAPELKARAVPDLTTLLREVPGIQLDPVVGSGAGVTIQGLGSDRVLVLVDGAPLAGRLSGELDLTRLDPAQFERIEIVEGPQSTLYGSAPLGGVVNLITRRDLAERAEFSARAGSRGQRDARVRASRLLTGSLVAALDAGRRTLDLAPGVAPGTAGYANRWDGMARLTSTLGSGDLDIRLLGVQDEQLYASGTTFNFNDNWQADGLARATLDRDGNSELRGHVSWFDHRLVRSTTREERNGTPEWDRQRLADLELLHRGALGNHRWLAGAKVEREWLESERVTGGAKSAWAGAGYASADWQLTGWLRFTTGVRLTASEDWGTDAAPRVAAALHLPAGFYLKTGLARGFRAPSFKELYLQFLNVTPRFSYAVRGSTDLEPESSWNATGEVGFLKGPVHLYARAFGNRLHNLIETVPAGDSAGVALFEYHNVGKARTGGADVGGSLVMGPAQATASYAFLDTEDEASQAELLGRARNSARAQVALNLPAPLTWRAEVVATGRVPVRRATDGTTTHQTASTRLNVGAALALRDFVRVNLGVDNVANSTPGNALVDYGRRWFASTTWGIPW